MGHEDVSHIGIHAGILRAREDIINDSQKSNRAQPRLLPYRHGQIRGNHIPRHSFMSFINAIEIARYAAVTKQNRSTAPLLASLSQIHVQSSLSPVIRNVMHPRWAHRYDIMGIAMLSACQVVKRRWRWYVLCGA